MTPAFDLDAHQAALLSLGFTVARGFAVPLLPALERLWRDSGIDATTVPGQRATRFGTLAGHEAIEHLFGAGPLGELLARLGGCQPVQDELNALDGDSLWHRDGAEVPRHAYRVALYLDPIEVGRGALSVVPASHLRQELWRQDALQALTRLEGGPPLDQAATAGCAVPLATEPGDVVLFHCGLMHASFGGGRRRQIAFVFVGRADSAADRLARTIFVLNRTVSGSVRFNQAEDDA